MQHSNWTYGNPKTNSENEKQCLAAKSLQTESRVQGV